MDTENNNDYNEYAKQTT